MEIEIKGLKIDLIKKKMKNIRIAVLPPDGKVRVTAPFSVSKKYIEELIISKYDWIIKEQKKYYKNNSRDTISIFGNVYPIKIIKGKNDVKIEDDIVIVSVNNPDDENKKQSVINEWYRNELKLYISERLPVWEEMTRLKSSSWQIKNMKTRWGSCNTTTKKLNFNLQLAQKDTECIDYVILHEVAHIKHPDHQAEFKAFLDKFMPDWRYRKKVLNGKT